MREDKLNQIEQMTNLTVRSEGVHVFHVQGNNMLSIYANTLTSVESIDVYNKTTGKKARPDKVLTTDAVLEQVGPWIKAFDEAVSRATQP